jgi:DeoR/GlpR family transcriptional regulator of sugar metabolism
MNHAISSLERQKLILAAIIRNQRISLAEVCEQFAVSEATARRDLESLAAEGKVQRVHGGAIALTQPPPESPILQRQEEQSNEKYRLGQAAAALVNEGETIYLGSGTTILAVARALRGRGKLTVITNSLPVINTLAGAGDITLICLGGMLRDSELSFIGHITEQALAEVRADKVIIGTRAISLEHGLTNDYLPETLTDRAILKAGREVIVAADHTKFGRVAHVLLAPITSVNTIVTDDQTPPDFVKNVQAQGIRVLVA